MSTLELPIKNAELDLLCSMISNQVQHITIQLLMSTYNRDLIKPCVLIDGL